MISYFVFCFYFLFFIISFFLCRKYIFYAWPALLCLTPPTFLVIDSPSLPILSVNRAILFIFLALYIFECVSKLKINFSFDYPFSYGVLFTLLSYLITLMLTGFQGISSAIGFFLEILFPMILYLRVRNFDVRENRLFLVVLFFTFFAFGLYTFLSFVGNYNPYLDVLRGTIVTERVSIITYENDWRGARALGTFGHPMTFGAVMGMGSLLGLYLCFSSKNYKKFMYLILSLSMLLFLFYSNSRSPLILVIVGLFFVFFGFNLFYKVLSLSLFVFCFLFAFSFSDYFKAKVYSIINIFIPTVGEDMKGSTIDMRIGQLKVAFTYMMQNPIWGNGIGFTRSLVEGKVEPGLYDSESAIFPIMIDQGMIGVLSFIILFFSIAYSFRYKFNNELRWTVWGIIGGYIAFILATGFLYTLPFFLYLMLVLYFDYTYRGIMLKKAL